jgi:hypothetical protein
MRETQVDVMQKEYPQALPRRRTGPLRLPMARGYAA